ncbi:PLDc N-terminal domain-containing protein [Corynebacterium uropygiale]|uniref:PLDc N-terminal domain-containing protein n=1 Tax=Corynebacterium uropygiale TaxID=1775911 RepID=A0A9X1QRE0_9CORY|nr:PLDc N-terminal domain-containing protein [Corynebacterium uropygiale]MCF4006373.1 PLDc N-terminal domain-containing protein [Corynebacterium uropygiale]
MTSRSLSQLSPQQRGLLGLAGVAQVGLCITALITLARTPKSAVRGLPRWAWVPVCFINFVGPIAFLTLGRKH